PLLRAGPGGTGRRGEAARSGRANPRAVTRPVGARRKAGSDLRRLAGRGPGQADHGHGGPPPGRRPAGREPQPAAGRGARSRRPVLSSASPRGTPPRRPPAHGGTARPPIAPLAPLPPGPQTPRAGIPGGLSSI